jgi:hypothetical protein
MQQYECTETQRYSEDDLFFGPGIKFEARVAGGEVSDFLGILKTPYAPPLRMYEVSREVNRASSDSPSLIEPVDGASDDAGPPLFKTVGK